jgi:hypothetical protein
MGKPREFWIIGACDLSKTSIAQHTKPSDAMIESTIHVIEIEAVRELEAKLKIATEALEDMNDWHDKEIAKEAIAKIGGVK